MNTNKWRQKTEIDAHVPDDYKKYALAKARRQFSEKIFDILFTAGQDWNVIRITEEIKLHPGYRPFQENFIYPMSDEIIHTLEYKPVQYQDVVMPTYTPLQFTEPASLKQRLRYLITGRLP